LAVVRKHLVIPTTIVIETLLCTGWISKHKLRSRNVIIDDDAIGTEKYSTEHPRFLYLACKLAYYSSGRRRLFKDTELML